MSTELNQIQVSDETLLHLANVEIHRLRGWQHHLRKTYYKNNRAAWLFQAHKQSLEARPIIVAAVERFGAGVFRRVLNSGRLSKAEVKPLEKQTSKPQTKSISGIKIETNIPISEPDYSGRPKSSIRLAIEALRVGDSFLVPKDAYRSGHIKALAKRVGIKVVCRIVNGVNRRVWRTA